MMAAVLPPIQDELKIHPSLVGPGAARRDGVRRGSADTALRASD